MLEHGRRLLKIEPGLWLQKGPKVIYKGYPKD